MAALFGFSQSDGYGLGVAIAPYRKLRSAPRRYLTDHAAKLCCPFDALRIDFRYDVVFLETGFRGRAVWNDGAEDHAAFGGKLQFLGGIAVDLVEFNAEPARAF